ncbi:Calcium-dependent lipid-binding (CaLB domain) family protein [Forsythia ovata]|uniref:Calcium-dependent lipid-binding (CaLB domain) family protein n=1 Tax=Forsythia ovata TaxID=205694 RepID=A0ABD1S0P2_9LAMI
MNPNPGSVAMDDKRNKEDLIGVLEVSVHQARNIHNICIYQNQDVYAKLFLTDDPDKKISTQIINGGGRNPVFNENITLNVQKMDSSLRCEVWMLSRVRNYLEDQLLGFTLVPLSDVAEIGKEAQEFELSSSDLFHSPAGTVQLTLNYTGRSPDIIEIPTPPHTVLAEKDLDVRDTNPCELDKIEFPDPKIVNDNERMVLEYFSIPCAHLDSKISRDCWSLENGNNTGKTDIHVPEKINVVPKIDTPSTNEITCSQDVCNAKEPSKSLKHDDVTPLKDKTDDAQEGESVPVTTIVQPLINLSIQPELKVNQKDIVDLYMKGMQQFTDALAKMKLPMDIGDGSTAEKEVGQNEETGSAEKAQESKSDGPTPSPRVLHLSVTLPTNYPTPEPRQFTVDWKNLQTWV